MKEIIRKLFLIELTAFALSFILYFINKDLINSDQSPISSELILANICLVLIPVIAGAISGSHNMERLIFIFTGFGALLVYYSVILLFFYDLNFITYPRLFVIAPYPMYVPPVLSFIQGIIIIIGSLFLIPKKDLTLSKVLNLKSWLLFIISITLMVIAFSSDSIIKIFNQLSSQSHSIQTSPNPIFPLPILLSSIILYIIFIVMIYRQKSN